MPGQRLSSSSFRGYKWDSLSEPEKDAVKDSLKIVGSRAAIGLGVVSTVAASIAGGKVFLPILPRNARMMRVFVCLNSDDSFWKAIRADMLDTVDFCCNSAVHS